MNAAMTVGVYFIAVVVGIFTGMMIHGRYVELIGGGIAGWLTVLTPAALAVLAGRTYLNRRRKPQV